MALLVSKRATAQDALDFGITDIHGKSWNLYNELAKGRVVVLDFFFADCQPCKEFTPQVVSIYSDYGQGDDRVLVLGLSDRDLNNTLLQFESDYSVNYPSAGVEGGGDTVTSLYKSWFTFLGWPTYAVICPDKSLFWDIKRETGLPKLVEAIDSCLSIPLSVPVLGNASESPAIFVNSRENKIIVLSHASSAGSLSLTTITGQPVRTYLCDMGMGRTAISSGDIPAGIYIATWEQDEKSFNKKIVIEH